MSAAVAVELEKREKYEKSPSDLTSDVTTYLLSIVKATQTAIKAI